MNAVTLDLRLFAMQVIPSALFTTYTVHLHTVLYVLRTYNTGFANFIDEWSQCDFCFTNFGVILEFGVKYHNEKRRFQSFQYVVLACIHYREGYTK